MGNQTLPSQHNEPSSLKHNGPTPGPWKVHSYLTQGPHCVYRDVGPGLRAVCNVIGEFEKPFMGAEQEANARLIAAAPEMLAALQMLHDDIAEYAHINNLGGFDNHAMRTARAAIVKAIGCE